MQSITSALDLDVAQVVRRGVLQAGEDGKWKTHHRTVVQNDHHALAASVVSCIHGEKLMLRPLGCPPRDRIKFVLCGGFKFTHEALSISRTSQEDPPLRPRQP